MNGSSTHDNFLTFFRYNNHGIIDKNLVQVKKNLNKKIEINMFSFSKLDSRFIKKLHLTSQGLLQEPGKNDRLIWDGSFHQIWKSK